MSLEKFQPTAIIFDMDGVLVDSEHWWQIWDKEFFTGLLGGWTEEQQQKIVGQSLKDIIENLLKEKPSLPMTETEFLARYNESAKEIYQKQCQLMPGALETLDFLEQMQIALALASSSSHLWINMVLKRFALKKYFSVIVSAQDVHSRGKPAPDIYLYTAKKLGVKPKDCLVIEDSTNGILSAKTAGMPVIGYRTPYNRNQNLEKADVTVEHLPELLNWLLTKLRLITHPVGTP